MEECYRRFAEQKGYTSWDIEACAQIRRSLDEAGEKGLDIYDIHGANPHLLEPQSGRTRSLPQYMEVNMHSFQSLPLSVDVSENPKAEEAEV